MFSKTLIDTLSDISSLCYLPFLQIMATQKMKKRIIHNFELNRLKKHVLVFSIKTKSPKFDAPTISSEK